MPYIIDRWEPGTFLYWAGAMTSASALAVIEKDPRGVDVDEVHLEALKVRTTHGEVLAGLLQAEGRELIELLVRTRILTRSLPVPERLFDLPLPPAVAAEDPTTFLVAESYQMYKNKMARRLVARTGQRCQLAVAGPVPEWAEMRRSCRHFSDVAVPQETFETLIASCGSRPDGSYRYASAGGLYPIDLYVRIREGGVVGWEEGLYLLHPFENQLELISPRCVFPRAAHVPGNEDMGQSSAFGIYVVFDPTVSVSKYGGMAYYYAILEAGAMMHHLAVLGASIGIASCQVGRINSSIVEKYFRFPAEHIYLQSLELGIEDESDIEMSRADGIF